MALDFNNRNPQDPNGIYAIDTVGAQDAWVNDDWSQVVYSQAEGRKVGANNKVKIATVTTNEGKKYSAVLGGDGKPISQIGDPIGQDDDQSGRWKQQQTAASKPPEERNNNGRRERWNPQTNGWDDVGAAINSGAATGSAPARVTGQTTQIEGKQTGVDAAGKPTYDNEQPVMVTRGPDGKLISSEPLTTAERKQWDEDRQKSRNPGGKTDADIQTAKKEEDARSQRDDATVADVSYTGTGKARQKVTTYKSGRKVTEAAPQTGTVTSVTYDPDGTKVTKYDDGTETTEDASPADQRAAAAAKDKGLPTVPSQLRGWRPDPSKPGFGVFERREQVIAAVNDGLISKEDGAKLLEIDADSARSLETQVHNERTSALTQRSQDLTRNANAASAANTANADSVKTWQELTANAAPDAATFGAALQGLRRGAVVNAGAWGANAPVTDPGMLSMAMRGPRPGMAPPGNPLSPANVQATTDTTHNAIDRLLNPNPPPGVGAEVGPSLSGAMGSPPVFAAPGGGFQAPAAPMMPQQPGLSAHLNYDPSAVNRELLAAGIPPEILAQYS